MKKATAKTEASVRDLGEKTIEMMEKSWNETVEMNIRMQDEALAALDRQVEQLHQGVRFALENQKNLLGMLRSNVEATRALCKDGMDAWASEARARMAN